MNNDMENKLNAHIDLQKNNSADNGAILRQAVQKTPIFKQNANMTNSVKKSVEEFLLNPEFVESYNDFCDSLVNKGYSLELAIDKTDKVFNILKDKNLYD